MNVKVELNEAKILEKVINDDFGKFVALSWKTLIDKYTPRDTNTLIGTVEISPFQIWYKQKYAWYIYQGEKYIDPLYGIGAFYSPDYGFWSRPGVTKIPSGEKLKFQGSGTDHWDEKAAQSGELNKLYRTLNNALRSGRY